MLRNPVYCGIIKAFGGEWPGGFEPIITRQLFLACQSNVGNSSWSKPRKTDNATFPLRKIVACSECGQPLTGSATRGRQGKRYPYYHHSSKSCSKPKTIAKEKFEKSFLEHLTKMTPGPTYERLFKSVVLDVWKGNHKAFDEQRKTARRRIEKLEQDRQRVFDMHRNGVYSDQDFRDQKTIVERQLEGQYALIEDRRADEFDMTKALAHCFEFVGNATRTWRELEGNHQARIRFQKLLFKDRLTYDGQGFGNSVLSPILQLKETSSVRKSLLVAREQYLSKGVRAQTPFKS